MSLDSDYSSASSSGGYFSLIWSSTPIFMLVKIQILESHSKRQHLPSKQEQLFQSAKYDTNTSSQAGIELEQENKVNTLQIHQTC